MMLTTLVTSVTFLLELCSSSPVYNMQPAFITANIGTTGRNIRNLPCISRKSNQSGVCMFAIDCLKANGTHLGTCIDRFYFGSCCHIKPATDFIDNSIESDIIPAREPPLRLSSTVKTTAFATSTTTTTPRSTTSKTTTTKSTTITTPRTTTIAKAETTIKPQTSSTSSTVEVSTNSTYRPLTKPSILNTTFSPLEDLTTIGYKLTTFQSVDGGPQETTTKIVRITSKPTRTTTTTTTAIKTKPSSTAKPLTKPPKTVKPTRTTTTTKKPTITTRKSTTIKKATSATPTKTPITRPTTTKPKTTIKATTKATTAKVTTTKASTTTVRTTKKPTTITTIPTTTTQPTTSSTVPNEVLKINVSSPALETVNGNIANNEIESIKPAVIPSNVTTTTTTKPTTNKPLIVTWSDVEDGKNGTTSTTANSTSEAWVPVTTPDGWVLLASVPANTTTSTVVPTPSSTTPHSEPSSAATITTTTESASKPSITYIPLESTTSSVTLNTSSPRPVEGPTTETTSTSTSPPLTTPPLEIQQVNMSDFTDVCGRRMFPEARIVGGEKSTFGKWPWQISLRQWRTSTYLHKCGAALLNENWAITAAHCVDNVPPSDLLLRLGEHDLSTESEPYLHQERRVQIVASHPQFDPRTFEYDLALLRFYEPVTFQPNILPVCVPQTDENFVGRTAYVTGWGRLYEDGPLPSVLQEVSVPVINNSVCESMYRAAGYIEHIPHIFICAGWRRGGFDSCEGDSGGPMVIQREDKRFLLAGVISWGIGCAEPNQPGVYTRISEFRDWINQILQF